MFSPIKLWIKKKSYKKKDFVSQKNVIGAKDFKSKKRIKIKRYFGKKDFGPKIRLRLHVRQYLLQNYCLIYFRINCTVVKIVDVS